MADDGPIELKNVVIEPNNCPLEQQLDLRLFFTTTEELEDARWIIKVRWQSHNKTLHSTCECAHLPV